MTTEPKPCRMCQGGAETNSLCSICTAERALISDAIARHEHSAKIRRMVIVETPR